MEWMSVMSMLVLWVVTSCGLVGRYRRFGRTCCLHFQGWSHRIDNNRPYVTTNTAWIDLISICNSVFFSILYCYLLNQAIFVDQRCDLQYAMSDDPSSTVATATTLTNINYLNLSFQLRAEFPWGRVSGYTDTTKGVLKSQPTKPSFIT
jgi:hypothetical protein